MANPRRKLHFGSYIFLTFVLIFTLFPVYYMVSVSFRSQSSLYINPSWLPVDLQIKNFVAVFQSDEFLNSLGNSLIISSVTTVVGLLFSVLAAYSLTILRYRGRDTLFRLIVVAFLTPSALLFIPLAGIASGLNLSNSLIGLILIYLSFVVPLGTYLLIGFFENLVGELEDAARIDGASRLQALWYVLVPLIVPGMVAVGILTFSASWNELLYSLVINVNPDVRTLPVAILNLMTADETPLSLIMAYSTMASMPIVILFYVGQRYIVEGLQTGAVKG